MRIDPAQLGAEQAYRLLTGVVVPRPIAWVTSLSHAGVVNLAPFSAFNLRVTEAADARHQRRS